MRSFAIISNFARSSLSRCKLVIVVLSFAIFPLSLCAVFGCATFDPLHDYVSGFMANIKSPKPQAELFEAQTSWFHIFKAMIDSGDAAEMGGTVFLVYAVVKSYTNWSTGRAFPSLDLIAEKAGVDRRTVIRALAKLEKSGYITREQKQGKANRYRLRERVPIEQDGRPVAVATWDYLPSVVGEAHAELKNFLATGLEGRIISIENLHLTINIAQDGGTVINNSGAVDKPKTSATGGTGG